MSADHTITLTPEQESDLEAASDVIYVEAADEMLGQTTGLDIAALLTIFVGVIMYHVLVPDLRDASQIGASIRIDSLRRAMTVVLGFLSLTILVGERGAWNRQRALNPGDATFIRWSGGLVLAIYTAYIASYTFFGLDLLTDNILPQIAVLAFLSTVIILWQPWTRIALYRKTLGKMIPALFIALCVLILWELLIKIFNIERFLLPAPTVIGSTFLGVYPRLVSQGWVTFQNALWGFGIGCGAGILFALLTARFTGFSKALMPYAIAVNSVPIVAFAPITGVWFGYTNPGSKIAIVAILTFFPAMINTVRGLASADAASLELMRSYAATEFEIFRKVRFPVALPYIFNALKVAATLSMIGAIVAEYFGGPLNGLGTNIRNDAGLLRFPLVWSQIVIGSLLGITFYFVVSLVERLVMPWHISFRGETD
jgi:NitT/TauT family transport system permease protein